jgi:hypothetical protein
MCVYFFGEAQQRHLQPVFRYLIELSGVQETD